MHDRPIQHRRAPDQVSVQGLWHDPAGRLPPLSRLTVMRYEVKHITLEPDRTSIVGAAQPHRALGDRVEDRLNVGRRARDDAQDLACRRLLLQGLGEVHVFGLELGEQPRVLDGDDRLVGEGGDHVDLRVSERADLRPPHEEQSNQLVLPQHRDGQHGSVAGGPLCLV